VTSSFQTKEAILYALGIGFSRDPYNQDELMFTYELHKKFRIFPTFACVFAKMDLLEFVASLNLPKFNPMMLLHGE
jgi:3-hydroxyacyl-CoA dehydrogenase/3a,7a,12a-trihydroxy-5b-cholest-24-enoyl-CoA hydratase/multifunctional beta-oxidation protein/peroxisomal enoyl-CoA hydratase 2